MNGQRDLGRKIYDDNRAIMEGEFGSSGYVRIIYEDGHAVEGNRHKSKFMGTVKYYHPDGRFE